MNKARIQNDESHCLSPTPPTPTSPWSACVQSFASLSTLSLISNVSHEFPHNGELYLYDLQKLIAKASFIKYPHYANLSFATDVLDKRFEFYLSNLGKNIQHVQQGETNIFCTKLLTV